MRKAVMFISILLIGSVMVLGQQRTFVELVTNTIVPEYQRTMEICDSLNAIYVVGHYHSQDPFTNQISLIRGMKYSNYSPISVVRGKVITDIGLSEEYVKAESEAGAYTFTNLDIGAKTVILPFQLPEITIKISNFNEFNGYLTTLFIVETVGTHKNVLRNAYELGTESVTFKWNDNYNENNMKVIVTVENGFKKIVGAFESNFLDLFNTTGIDLNEITAINIYPNPATDILHIDGCKSGDLVMIYNTQGQILFREQVFNGQIALNKFSQGVYYLKIGNNVKNFVVQ